MEFKKHNKILINEAVEFYSECLKDMCEISYSPEIRKQQLIREIKAIKSEAIEGTIVDY